jgi:hypothetical protein
MLKKIEAEINDYIDKSIDLSDGVTFSQYKEVVRITKYQNHTYAGNKKTDSQGNYKYWSDIISPRVDSEVKNIDFDTRDVVISSKIITDRLAVFISNLYLGQWMENNKKAEAINEDVEDFSAWGNVVWKKVKDGYEKVDLKNFYVLNQTAKTLDDSDVIERHLLTQADLRAKSDVWKNVDVVIKNCGDRFFKETAKATETTSSTPYYEIYERNGDVSTEDLKKLQGKTGGDKDKYVLAKVIVAGLKSGEGGERQVLFAEEISEKPYREAHRSRFEGRWFRKGLYETLMDCQVRANEISYQIARGLEWASKAIFKDSSELIVQNVLTNIRNGDIIKTQELSQVEVRMQGLDQLIADWNRNLEMADRLANSYEVVRGESLPSGTPFRLGSLIDQNANKLFNFLREKLALGLEAVFNDWILPDVMKELRKEKIIELTGNEKHLEEYHKMLAKAWYIKNLLIIPPHSAEQAEQFLGMKAEEYKKNDKTTIEMEKTLWQGFKPRARVRITGEGVDLTGELQTLANFIQLEMDPVRRSALIEMAMSKKGVDITNLPKTEPELMAPQQPQTA